VLEQGRVSHMLNSVPVYAVMVEDMGRRGAHRTAFIDFLSVEDINIFKRNVGSHEHVATNLSKASSDSCGGCNANLCLAAAISAAMFIFAKYR